MRNINFLQKRSNATAGSHFYDDDSGSILLMTMFLLLFLATILLGYWQVIRYKTKMTQLKQQSIRAQFAARAGLSDALYELKQLHTWDSNNDDLSDQWHFLGGDTFYKSSQIEPLIPQFSYPVTISVTVSGNPTQDTLSLTSRGDSGYGTPEKSYSVELKSKVVRSLFGKMHTLEVEGN
ncbi:hypothetical protein DID80_04285 [Candidatus Marinamargulisbacteria bacterium SCGC AAA071-K20]|nr:hypothetical protein DID80_04285 [Candidatus Marinamargulisbacteria bacterium SCGC AAA071-K20]